MSTTASTTLVEADTLPELTATLDTAESIDTAGGGSVTVYVEREGTRDLIVNDTATVDDDTQGSADVSYQLSSSQTAFVGSHKVRWVVTYPDGDTESFPKGAPDTVTFSAQLNRGGSITTTLAGTAGPLDVIEFNELGSDPSAPAVDDWGLFFKQDGSLYKIDENGTVSAVGGGGSSVAVEDDGTEIVATVAVLNFAGSQFDVTNPTGDEAQVVIGTDVIGTDELDLSIAPTWTSQHQFPSLDIGGDWDIDSATEATLQRLRIQGTGANDAAELFLQAKGTSNVARYTATPDNSTTNFSGITVESNGTNQFINSIAEGTASALALELRMAGTALLRLTTGNAVEFPNITGTPTMASHDHSEGGMTTVPNAGLTNSSVTVAGNSVSLGASTAVSVDDLSDVASSTESAGDLPIWNATNTQFENAALTGGDGVTVTNADASVTLAAALATSGGLKISSSEIAVEPNDFAGNGVKDDGSDNLEVEPADFAGAGLEDDGSDNLQQAPVPSPETVSLGGTNGSISPTDKRVNPLTVLVDAGGSATELQGIDGVATHGQKVIVQHTGGENVTLAHNDGGATNPLLNTSLGDEVLDANDELAEYVYDGTAWRQLASNIV